MENDEGSTKAIENLRRQVAAVAGLPEVLGTSFFLLRVGGDYRDYMFSWEPFRDLAGPLERSPSSLPIVLISSDGPLAPEVAKVNEPMPHYQIRISRAIGPVAIANVWIELLQKNGASYGQYKGPFHWFAKGLEESVKIRGQNTIGWSDERSDTTFHLPVPGGS